MEQANAVWGTRFPEFAVASASKDLRDGPGLWVDRLKRNSCEWCAGLKEFAAGRTWLEEVRVVRRMRPTHPPHH